MAKGRILFVNQEIMPYMPETENSYLGRYLPQFALEKDRDIRVFMPRFSCVNERKNQLHEVIRLSGMNLIVNNCDHQLIIKVGSLPSARMQVYFIDNEEYFTKSDYLYNEDGTFIENNDERILFYGHSTLEAVRKLAWQPHLIHFTGWFSSMIPFYLKRINKENAFFSGTRTVFTLTDDAFQAHLGADMERKMKNDGATAKDLRIFSDLNYMNLMKAVITYAHAIVIGSPNANPELVAFAKENKRQVLDFNPDRTEFYTQINKLYDQVIGSNINN